MIWVNDSRYTEIHTSELLVPEHRPLEVVTEKYESSGTDQILAELIQTSDNTSHCEMYELNNSLWNTEELLGQ
jgi:hypothetical protein